jgi:predicted peptidase
MKTGFLIILMYITTNVFCQNNSLYEKRLFISGGDTLPYRLLLPKNYDGLKKYPIVFFLHGAGERGNDNERQLGSAANLFLKDSLREKYTAIVVFPQCPKGGSWSSSKWVFDTIPNQKPDPTKPKGHFEFPPNATATKEMKLLMKLIGDLENKYKLDKERFYVGGFSMGAMGTFELVNYMQNKFAAAFPICGGAHVETAKNMRKTSWWMFHGGKDLLILPESSEKMAVALKSYGADVKRSLYPEVGHSQTKALAENDLLQWLFSQRR